MFYFVIEMNPMCQPVIADPASTITYRGHRVMQRGNDLSKKMR